MGASSCSRLGSCFIGVTPTLTSAFCICSQESLVLLFPWAQLHCHLQLRYGSNKALIRRWEQKRFCCCFR